MSSHASRAYGSATLASDFPLPLPPRGRPVADLQQALMLLGFDVPNIEQRQQVYGPRTRAAVQRFQLAQRLPETGQVDQTTAAALNAALRGRRTPGLTPTPPRPIPAPPQD